ncbi:DUF3515 domain-containing protein [Actinophytocola oryzae]|uniref:Uncharacterized protein DUF3515 n=1 Tax=Actinophytocola oryzae TaxID=502181 RepID=A0A4R7UT93_9PSEU|nr:DUF3515 domain-containing protein [Actinophytocola oryzae]TDV39839.1 uncharacterized protein DUF3515 [Actinophytocola oryzae]
MSEQPLSRVTLFVAAGLAAVLVVGVIVASRLVGGSSESPAEAGPTTQPPRPTGPLALVAVDAPDAAAPACGALVNALPTELPSKGKELTRLAIADPAPPASAAWAGDRGEPVVLRCGLGKPPELVPTAQLRLVSKVNWLPIEGAGATTWYTVDRPVYIALTIPDDAGTGVVQEMSETIAKSVPAA